MKKLVFLGVFAALSTGCATQTYLLSNQSQATPSVDKAQTFFVSGLAQQQEINAAEVCNGANNVAKVEAQHSFLNGVLGTISSGIYTPRQVRIYCK